MCCVCFSLTAFVEAKVAAVKEGQHWRNLQDPTIKRLDVNVQQRAVLGVIGIPAGERPGSLLVCDSEELVQAHASS